jgi:hypothetical protein
VLGEQTLFPVEYERVGKQCVRQNSPIVDLCASALRYGFLDWRRVATYAVKVIFRETRNNF